jgi:WD40 repeat protein
MIWAVAFSPDGKTVLTGGDDWSAQLWDAATGQTLGSPLPHPAGLSGVAFSPDSQTLLTGCQDGSARLWDVQTRKPIGPPLLHEDEIKCVAFAPDGRTVLTGSNDATARLWRVPELWQEDAEQIILRLQVTTGLELHRDSGTILALDADAWKQRRQRLP